VVNKSPGNFLKALPGPLAIGKFFDLRGNQARIRIRIISDIHAPAGAERSVICHVSMEARHSGHSGWKHRTRLSGWHPGGESEVSTKLACPLQHRKSVQTT
jgi:hypothetical protein